MTFKYLLTISLLINSPIAMSRNIFERNSTVSIRTANGVEHLFLPKELRGKARYEISLDAKVNDFKKMRPNPESNNLSTEQFAEDVYQAAKKKLLEEERQKEKIDEAIRKQELAITLNTGNQNGGSTLNSHDPEIILLRANQLFNQNNFSNSLQLLKAAEKISPKNARIFAMKGSIYWKMGWIKMAKIEWVKSLKLDPNQKQLIKYLKKIK